MTGEILTTDYPDYDRSEVVPFIPSSARRVLDVGCAGGGFGRTLGAPEMFGVEPNPAAAQAAEKSYRAVYRGLYPDAVPEGETFDCIVFNDVLEHLVDPYSAVVATRKFLAPGGRIVASIPNMRYLPVLKQLLVDAEWQYTDEGVLDRTHLRWFTYKTMRRLFEDHGFVVERMEPIGVLDDWRGRLFRTSRRTRDLLARQFVVVARPSVAAAR